VISERLGLRQAARGEDRAETMIPPRSLRVGNREWLGRRSIPPRRSSRSIIVGTLFYGCQNQKLRVATARECN
jgi:hypothetical protein